eukprot:TRINITY_DN156_c0_g1_i10.p1 TRINITY_DN156_c0_g1~~TRINITY_DN156_c0_g1_i10.p1  ORF type:complete len:629 (+),score=174.37 TRINITY_DN156_c0_g1_i10:77-1963(+)
MCIRDSSSSSIAGTCLQTSPVKNLPAQTSPFLEHSCAACLTTITPRPASAPSTPLKLLTKLSESPVEFSLAPSAIPKTENDEETPEPADPKNQNGPSDEKATGSHRARLVELLEVEELGDFDDRVCEFMARFIPGMTELVRKIVGDYFGRRDTIKNPSAYIVATLIRAQHQLWARQEFSLAMLSPASSSKNNADATMAPKMAPSQLQLLRATFDSLQYTRTGGLDVSNLLTALFAIDLQPDLVAQWDLSRRVFNEMVQLNPASFKGSGVSHAAFKRYCDGTNEQQASLLQPLDRLLELAQIRGELWKAVRPLVVRKSSRSKRSKRFGSDPTAEHRVVIMEVACDRLGLSAVDFSPSCVKLLSSLDSACVRSLVEYATLVKMGHGNKISDVSLYVSQNVNLIRLCTQTRSKCEKNPRQQQQQQQRHANQPRAAKSGMYTDSWDQGRYYHSDDCAHQMPAYQGTWYHPVAYQHFQFQPPQFQHPYSTDMQHGGMIPDHPYLHQQFLQYPQQQQHCDMHHRPMSPMGPPCIQIAAAPAEHHASVDLPGDANDADKDAACQRVLGELLFCQIDTLPEAEGLVPKLTGMLLELPDDQIKALVIDKSALAGKVGEALEVLWAAGLNHTVALDPQ